MEKVWRKPLQGVVKINFDATITGKKMSYRLVARDHDGLVLSGRAGVLDKNVQVEWAKLQALEESISSAQSKNWSKLEFEFYCVSLVNHFNKKNDDITTMGHRIQEIYRLMGPFYSFNFTWAPRCCNKVADYLCNWAKAKNCTMDFNMDYPSDIHELVLNDAIS
ncbi:hypothetical protein PVK06_008466 [Gossypium arboreum]|uniref:RNase H type-1 domain-containing protein n=1 Tax=Gossypium arboreum TaxID=29729 RepID=A0ABR0QLC9_GOSAR|nr:hypothetical protein PVK06_008466 [Gossypium arboreum]